MAAPSGCLRGRKSCDAINGCPQMGASIDSLLLVTDRISCFSHVIIVSTTFRGSATYASYIRTCHTF